MAAGRVRAMLRWALESQAPIAIRYSRGGVTGEPLGRAPKIVLGKAEPLRQGSDLTILAAGSVLYPALEAATRLRQEGLDVGVVNARFIKPLDRVLLRQLAGQTGALITIEEAQVAGGFGSAVSEAWDEMGLPPIAHYRIGLSDQFVEHGKRSQLLRLCRLDAEGLTHRIATWHSALKHSGDPAARAVAEPAE